LPPPSAEAILLRTAIMAFIAISGRRKAAAFLREMAVMLADEEAMSLIFPIRPSSNHAEVSRARREAIALFEAHLPAYMARMMRE
jgi:hypothetical protein